MLAEESASLKELTKDTQRQYATMQEDFRGWCGHRRLRHPVAPNFVAAYLAEILAAKLHRGAVYFRVAAIGRWYREQGYQLDTKQPSIQAVLTKTRPPGRGRRRAAALSAKPADSLREQKPSKHNGKPAPPKRPPPDEPVDWWSTGRRP